MSQMLWGAGKAFLIALILSPIIRDIFRSYNVVDRPDLRKVHAYPIPRLGGIAIAVAYAIPLVWIPVSGDPLRDSSLAVVWKLLPGGAVIFLTGILDDFFNLPPIFKLLGQIAAAVVVFWSGVRIDTIARLPVPVWLGLPVTVFWLLLTMNAFNLIDGLDGLCTGIGLVATGTLFTAASIQGNVPLEYATLPLAGALLGFWGYNFSPATIFLGDSGALLIGFLLGCYGIVWTQKTSALLILTVPLLALSVPLMDVLLSVARRFLSSRPIFSADRAHVHHRLLDRGLAPRRVALVLYLWAIFGAAFALLIGYPGLRRFQGLAAVAFCGATCVGVRQLRYPEFDVAGKLLFRGEFQRALKGQVRIQQLAADFARSRTEDEWWNALATGVRDAGWTGVKWLRDRSVRREQMFPGRPAAWSFRVALNDREFLEIDGPFQGARPPMDLMAFAEAASGGFARSRSWEESALT